MISSKMSIQLRSVDSITEEVLRLQNDIAKRAYEIFLSNSSPVDHALNDWLAAENELACRPGLELREKDNAFDAQLALAGYEPKEIDVRVTPDQLLMKAETGRNINKMPAECTLASSRRGDSLNYRLSEKGKPGSSPRRIPRWTR